jgi:hypothetical protein
MMYAECVLLPGQVSRTSPQAKLSMFTTADIENATDVIEDPMNHPAVEPAIPIPNTSPHRSLGSLSCFRAIFMIAVIVHLCVFAGFVDDALTSLIGPHGPSSDQQFHSLTLGNMPPPTILFTYDAPQSQPPLPLTQRGAWQVDPLDDFLHTFLTRLVEPHHDDSKCMVCFFNDSSRVRRVPSAPPDAESFIMYHSSSGLRRFQIFTHVFTAQREEENDENRVNERTRYKMQSGDMLISTDNPSFGFPRQPFDFFVSNELEDDSDNWESVPVSYTRMGSRQGWENRVFYGEPRSSPNSARYLKITINDIDSATWRVQIGQVYIQHNV